MYFRWFLPLFLFLQPTVCSPVARKAQPPAVEARQVALAGAQYDVVLVDLQRAQVRLYWQDEQGQGIGTFARLGSFLREHGQTLLAATNAGIFEPGYVPTGLHIERGRTLRPLNLSMGEGNFFLRPNGVFYIGAQGAGIVPSEGFAAVSAGVQEATQSGPLLLLDGAVPQSLSPGSIHKKLRSGVCVLSPRRIALAISRGAITFFALAQMFQRLGCRSALYLDGTISGLYAPGLGRQDAGRGPFAGLLGITQQ